MKETNYAFRLLSAFAIITVVAGHMEHGGLHFLYRLFVEYQFHVVTFVFIAGYFYKETVEDAIWPYIRKKALHLLVPMYAWNLIYGILVQWMKQSGIITFGVDLSFDSLVILPLYHGHQFFFTLALWFVPPLFFAETLHVLLRRVLRTFAPPGVNRTLSREFFFLLLCLAFGITGVELAMHGLKDGWWLLTCKTFIFLGFLGLGRFYRAVAEKREPASHLKYFAAILLLQAPLRVYFSKVYDYDLDLQLSWCLPQCFILTGPILPFLLGTLGILFWLRVCKILAPYIGKNRLANLIGENTFSIMVHHLMGAMCLKLALAAIAMAFGLSFFQIDLQRLQNDIWYYPLFGTHHLPFIYLAVGIAFSLFVKHCEMKLRTLVSRVPFIRRCRHTSMP